MDYRALIVDMDDTLLHNRVRHSVSEEAAAALTDLQRRGILVVVATGRAPAGCKPPVFSGFWPDYFVYVNGASVQDGVGTSLFEDRFTQQDMDALLGFAQDRGFPACLSFEDAYYVYVMYDAYRARYEAEWGDASHIKDGASNARHLESQPFSGFALAPAEDAADFNSTQTDLRMVRATHNAYDVCKRSVNKGRGLDVLLQKLCLGWHQVVAVGDGDNDVEMLQKAGVGVAMGNASDGVKQAADAVAPDVTQDGILWVVEHYFPA